LNLATSALRIATSTSRSATSTLGKATVTLNVATTSGSICITRKGDYLTVSYRYPTVVLHVRHSESFQSRLSTPLVRKRRGPAFAPADPGEPHRTGREGRSNSKAIETSCRDRPRNRTQGFVRILDVRPVFRSLRSGLVADRVSSPIGTTHPKGIRSSRASPPIPYRPTWPLSLSACPVRLLRGNARCRRSGGQGSHPAD
jgi:hypothetical protein